MLAPISIKLFPRISSGATKNESTKIQIVRICVIQWLVMSF